MREVSPANSDSQSRRIVLVPDTLLPTYSPSVVFPYRYSFLEGSNQARAHDSVPTRKELL